MLHALNTELVAKVIVNEHYLYSLIAQATGSHMHIVKFVSCKNHIKNDKRLFPNVCSIYTAAIIHWI